VTSAFLRLHRRVYIVAYFAIRIARYANPDGHNNGISYHRLNQKRSSIGCHCIALQSVVVMRSDKNYFGECVVRDAL
jgi:hypothetical protein